MCLSLSPSLPSLPAGLLPYYFHKLTDPARAQEVDRCVYNNMFDNPECKNASIPTIKNVHFTVCQKPWTCYTHAKNVACTPFMEKWFELRREVSVGMALGNGRTGMVMLGWRAEMACQ